MIELMEGFTYYPQAEVILSMPASREFFNESELKPIEIGKIKLAPWGDDNKLPENIIKLVEKSEVISSNLLFNTAVGYGLGVKPMRRLRDEAGKVCGSEEITEGEIYDFFEQNDLGLFLLEQLTDINYFYNAFAEIILSEKNKKIVALRSKEAVFSRWEVMNKEGRIEHHYYSSKWGDNPQVKDVVKTYVLDEYNPLSDLTTRQIRNKKEYRFIFPVFMPTPARPYYAKPPWWSIFESGWYDHSVMIPELKNTIVKNKLGVKFIVYISNEYFTDIFVKEGIDSNDKEAVRARIEKEKQNFNNFLSGEKNAGKSIMAFKKTFTSSNSVFESKYVEIVPVKNDLAGGELIEDSEEANNLICYAMGIHPNLIGATPGKSGNSMGGTDKRELFMMKQALTRPVIDRVLRVFKLIAAYNKWDKDFYVAVPEWLFTTLDKNKTGKEVKE